MPSLREIQASCYEAFAGAAQPAPTAGIVDNAIPARVRVSVYRNNAREVFRGTLAQAYPVVAALVGEACFRTLATELRTRNPSRSGDLQDFLTAFPTLLSDLYLESEFAYLPDVAALELAIEQAMLLRDTAALPIERLAQIDEASLARTRLVLAPSLRIIRSAFPILTIWRAHRTEPVRAVDVTRGGENVGVLRRGEDAELRLLDDATCALARQISAGYPLGEAFDALAQLTDTAALGAALHALFASGCVTALHTP